LHLCISIYVGIFLDSLFKKEYGSDWSTVRNPQAKEADTLSLSLSLS